LSALAPAAFTPHEIVLVLSRPHGHSATGTIMSMKNSNDTTGNRTRDLSACSAVPQPTAPPRAPPQSLVYFCKIPTKSDCTRTFRTLSKSSQTPATTALTSHPATCNTKAPLPHTLGTLCVPYPCRKFRLLPMLIGTSKGSKVFSVRY
jgi:hypothetical protein